ncbi:protein SCAR2 isoform X2 [Solanum tuberosum]|uniref:protein SCAR2 isoform X2 n=1 Tax=Solanum tuberosum TaxID=4113 RepID=UPI0003D27455|nr:PREDICTED: protein SCAR2 isoform X2 [Solanum tuberosum]
MPVNRYQIRNEYSLADPELYKSADKDDPEALLEGVAMAGLVGVLRQLGDLAEFAAEIFHDLHEEVMATAARGHSLTARVKQLEADFPLIERAFLSQTNHSSFFYNAGTDWHPNLRIDQNMVTRGDLPRFVMDSYEECRGPPRLFLLDKFDVAGAGACLKRYTDPSSFKVETSSYAFTTSDVQREKKTRKTKKRGSRWRNGETPEVLPTSHAKLHQLFLEERIENGINVPAHRVKLKRKLNGFPFDPKTGKSYMNKFLEASSPEHKVVHEVGIDSSPLRLPSTDAYETLADTEDIRPPSPDKEVMRRNKRASLSPSPPQSEENNSLRPCLDEVNEDLSHYRVRGISRRSHKSQTTDILPSIHSVVDEKEITVDGESRTEKGIGYESDDVASEIDNYVDALTTMEAELETDSEQRDRRDLHFLNSKKQVLCLSSSSEKLQTQSSDSHSIENSTLSDDGNSYSKKEISSFSCSDSPSTSVESVLLESEISSKGAKTSDTSCEQQYVNEETQLPQPPEDSVYDRKCITVAREPSGSCDSGMRAETNENFVTHGKSEDPLTTIAEDASSLHVSLPHAPVILDAPERNGDDSPSRASIDVKLTDGLVDRNLRLDENVSCSSHSDVPCHARDNMPESESPEIQHEINLYNDDASLVNNLPFTSELLNVPSEDRREVLSSDYQQLPNLDGEDPSVGDDSASLYNLPNCPSSEEGDTSPSLLAVNHPNHVDDGLDNENSNGSSVGSVQILDVLGASDKDCGKHFTMSHDEIAEDACMKPHNISTKDIEAGNTDKDCEETCGAFSDAVMSEPGDLSTNCGGDGLDFVDVLNPQTSEIATDIQPLESGELDISCSRQENPVEVSSLTKNDEKGSIAPSELLSGTVSTGSITSPHLKSLTNEGILSDETVNKIDKSDVTDETASPLAALADKENFDDLSSSLDHKLFSEESVCSIGHSGQNELEIDLPNSHAESKFMIQRADTPESNSFVLDTSNCHHPESAVLDTLSGSELSFDAENTVDSSTAPSQAPLKNWCLDTEEVLSRRRNVADSTEDASSLQISPEEGKDELEDNQPNEELLHKVDLDQSPHLEKIQSHVDQASDASSLSFLANLPSQDAIPDVFAHNSNQVPQPLLTGYCAEERAESTIHEQVKREVLDNGEAKSEPLPQLTQSQLVDCFDIEQSAEASSISSQTVGPSHPSFPELLSQSNQDSLSSLYKKDEEIASKVPDNERVIDEDTAKEVLLPQFEEARLSNHVDIVGALDASLVPFIVNVPSQSSVSNPLPLSSHNVNPFEIGNISTSPGFSLLPDEPQISLAEMPPLPPLPPIQWRMGKLHSSPDLDGDPTQHYIGDNQSSLASRTDQNAQPVNQNMLSAVATESSELIDMYSADSVAQSGQYHEVQLPSLHAIRRGEAQPINWIPDVTSLDKPSIDVLGSSEVLIQRQNQVAPELLPEKQGSAHLEGNLPLPVSDGIKPKALPTDTVITDASESLFHEPSQPQHQPLHQLAPETCLNKSNLEETLTSLEKNVVTHGTVIPSYTESATPDHSVPTTEAEIIWPAVEEGNTNEIRIVKLQRPRTPLIDDLAAHDKSKLRKVTERVRPEIQKVDERDSLLQLRKVTERDRPEIQKVDEKDSLLQLRKVTERARPEIQKVDEKDSLLQLRKVTERARPEIQKVDEKDSLLQLRKVTERARPEIQKVDEKDSLLQLRKVTERARPEIQKVDEKDSLLQLRKVTERARPEIQKVDEKDSLLQLRKVTERAMPEIPKVDERDSLLEQIRKKSFNLKPTVATRPSIQGPQTNLRVAAILEKAKTIRQAFAGSDEEDDEDSWSDS